MYGLSPDLQWLEFSNNKGPWSVEAEEKFAYKLQILNDRAKRKQYTSYQFRGDFELTLQQYNSFKNKVLGIKKPEIKVEKFNGVYP